MGLQCAGSTRVRPREEDLCTPFNIRLRVGSIVLFSNFDVDNQNACWWNFSALLHLLKQLLKNNVNWCQNWRTLVCRLFWMSDTDLDQASRYRCKLRITAPWLGSLHSATLPRIKLCQHSPLSIGLLNGWMELKRSEDLQFTLGIYTQFVF